MVDARLLSENPLITHWWNNRRSAIWTFALLAFVIRVAASLALKTYEFDAWRDHWTFGYEWGRIAKWLVATNRYTLNGTDAATITEPVYSFIIAAFFYTFGTFTPSAALALIIFQSLLCSLCTWAIFVLAERLYGPLEARVSALLFALYPAAILFSIGRIGPSILTALLLCLIFLLAFTLAEAPRLRTAILAGSITGVLLLTASHPLSLFVIVPVWLLWVGKNKRLRMVLVSLVFLGTATLVMTPWAIRNSLMTGKLSAAKTGPGTMLWRGNNPVATGYTLTRFPGGGPGPEEHVYLQMAISWIEENPKDFALLTLKRIVYFWSVIPRSTSKLELLNGFFFLMATALGIWGALWPGLKHERVWLILLFFAIFPLVFYLTVISHYRYRFYVEPLMLVLASRGIHRLAQSVFNARVISAPQNDPLNLATKI